MNFYKPKLIRSTDFNLDYFNLYILKHNKINIYLVAFNQLLVIDMNYDKKRKNLWKTIRKQFLESLL